MQVLELLNLTFWIDENIKKNAVAQKYQELQSILQQNVTTRNNQP